MPLPDARSAGDAANFTRRVSLSPLWELLALKGHGFSRANMRPVLLICHPERRSAATESKDLRLPFPRPTTKPLSSQQGERPASPLASASIAALKRHGFGRANISPKQNGALAPGGRLPHFALLLVACIFSACTVGPNSPRTDPVAPPAYKEAGAPNVIVPPPSPAGGSWQPASPSDGMLRGKWWEIYQAPQLNELEDQVAPRNETLPAA